MPNTRRHVEMVNRAIERAVEALSAEKNPRTQADVSAVLAARCREGDEQFSELRSVAFTRYREEFGYSLADLKAEFGISRARAAQIITKGKP